jgi:hypothetical protein
MQVKLYKMRSLTHQDGKKRLVDLELEFEGKRAYAILDSIPLGNYRFTARIELDPKRLRKSTDQCCDYFYSGKLVLPRPENN